MMKIELFFLAAFYVSLSHEIIDWQSNNSATDCDFQGSQNLGKILSKKEECILICTKNATCTHYTWNVYGCFLKLGWTSKEEAIPNKGAICGILVERLIGGKFKLGYFYF